MKRGFTLLELIVAMVLFTIVMSAAYALFDSTQDLSSGAGKVSEMQQEARFVLEHLRRDLQGTTAIDAGDTASRFLGTDNGSDEEPLDEIQFLSINRETLWSTQPESDMSMTRYYVIEEEESTDQEGLVRIRNTDLLSTTTVQEEEEEAEEIGPNVVFVNFRYHDGNEWQESWDSSLSLSLPRAIEVTIHIRVPGTEIEVVEFSSKIYLPIAAETPTLSEVAE
jgi:type II secretion system protein J